LLVISFLPHLVRIGLGDFPAGPGDDADSLLSDGIDQVPSQSIAGNAHQPFFSL
jgi:hypothetical protein